MTWVNGPVRVERIGGALWIEHRGEGVLVDAPPGTASSLGDRLGRLRSVVLTSGRLERVSGLVSVLGALVAPGSAGLTVRFPLSDERGALLVEAWQRAWPDREVTVDGVGPGAELEIVGADVLTVALSDPGGEPPPMGLRFVFPGGPALAVLPRCRLDGAVRRAGRGADLLVIEPGGLSAREALDLGARELWLEPTAEA